MKHAMSLLRLGAALFALTAVVLLSASHTPTQLEQVLESGQLHVVSRNGPTTYFEGRTGLDGYEYQLAKGFAEELGVELVLSEEEDLGKMLSGVSEGKHHLAAAGLTVTPERAKRLLFTAPYKDVQKVVVYRTGSSRPSNIEDLYGKQIITIAHSSHAEALQTLKEQYPELEWNEQPDLEMSDLMDLVNRGEFDIAVLDSNAYHLNRNLYPRAKQAFVLGDTPDQLAWAFSPGSDKSLYERANRYLVKAREQGLLAQLDETFYDQIDHMDTGSALTFAHRLESRLPRWQEYMELAGEMFNLDWMLIAAISYQESHWNSRARSYTGVRGLMMLTHITAKEVGVDNRLDPAQSIYGGSKYFRKIFDRIPEDIQGADRTWLALAAYNVGFGHMEDARVLTERMGGDPDRWDDVREHLPLLAKRKYYRTVKHGYARGWEPVKYVDNIRNFYNTIALYQQLANRRLAALQRQEGAQMPAQYSSETTGDDLSML